MNPLYNYEAWKEYIDPGGEMDESEWTELSDLQRLSMALACFPNDRFEIISLNYGRCHVRIFPEREFIRWEIVEFIHHAVYLDGGNYRTVQSAIIGLIKAL